MLEKLPLWIVRDPTLHIVGRLCVRDALKRYLLVRRPANAKTDSGLWEFPGGQCEEEEKHFPILGAKRETGEETGLKPAVASFKHLDVHTKDMTGGDKDGHKRLTYTYPAHVNSDDLLRLPEFQLQEVEDATVRDLEAAFQLELTAAANQTLGRLASLSSGQ